MPRTKSSPSYYPVTRREMETFLLPKKFVLLNDPKDKTRAGWPQDLRDGGVQELVYGCRVRPYARRLCVRVYSGIWLTGESRDVGEDAIRVLLVWLDTEPYEEYKTDSPVVRIVGMEKRVHRMKNWAENLQNRINGWQECMGPDCPACGAPMVERHKKNDRKARFWGCCRFHSGECKATLPYP